MPDLQFEIDSNLKEIAADVKRLNNNFEEAGNSANNAGRNAKTLGENMMSAFKGFLVGGAIQKGFTKIISDIDESNRKAKVLADSLRTLRFLGDASEVSSARGLQSDLARFGIQPSEVGPAAANVLSTAGGLPLSTREQILRESGAAQAGGIGGFGGFSDFLATGSQAAPQFQTPSGITKLANLGAQGITEAKLPPERVGALTKALLIGINGGLSPSESLSAFAVLSKIESSDDAANEKLKQLLKSWAVTGARDNGISFIGYVQATAEKGIKDLVGEEKTLQGPTIKPFAKQSSTFAEQTARIQQAGAGQSITEQAFQKQLADPQTRQNILNEEQSARLQLITSDPSQRASTEALGDISEAVYNGVTAAFKFGASVSPAGLATSAIGGAFGSETADIGGILRESAGTDIDKASLAIESANKALQNNTNAMQSMSKNVQVNSKLGGNN